jgi:hypothetical protein
MKTEQKQMNIIRLMAHQSDLQELIMDEISHLVDDWRQHTELVLSSDKRNLVGNLSARQASAFTTQLYDNIWAAILEEENWNEDSILAQYAWAALPNANSPYGYRIIYRNQKPTLVPDSIESEVVKLIYTWYTEMHYSLRDVAEALTALHLPTPYDIHLKRKASATWGIWDMTVIHRIISSPTYAGQWSYYDGYLQKSVTVEVPALISSDIYEKAQACLLANVDNPQHALKYEYLLAFRTTCGVCGSHVQLRANRSAGMVYQYYRCPTPKCLTRGFRADEIDPIVWSWIHDQLESEVATNTLLETFQIRKESLMSDTNARLQIVDKYLNEYRRQLANLSKPALPGSFLEEALSAYQNRLSLAVQSLGEARCSLESKLQELNLAELSLPITDDDFAAKRLVIDLLDTHIIIRGRNDNRQVQVVNQLGKKQITLAKRRLQ